MTIDFDTPTNTAFVALGALPPGQHWSRFDVPAKQAAEGKASVLVTSIWNFHWSHRGSTRVATRPAVSRDTASGTLWCRMDRPGLDAVPTGTAHWNRIRLARELAVPIRGVLKDYSTSRCSLSDTFVVVDVRDDVGGEALWLQLQPVRPLVTEVNAVDIREVTGAPAKPEVEPNPEVLAIESVIRPTVSAAGQVWVSDPAKRRAIERYAMVQAIAHYQKTWPTVEDVSAKESFDLRCRHGELELRVEVKGTSTAGGTVLLTRNEVQHVQDPKNTVALFVVSGIQVGADNTCAGGVSLAIEPWRLDTERLSAVAYEYRLW